MAERGEGELITFPGVAAFGHGDGEKKKGNDGDDEKKKKKGQCARSKVVRPVWRCQAGLQRFIGLASNLLHL